MNPRTKEDFDLLYHALESKILILNKMICSFFLVWRQDELERINSTTSGPERKAALCMLLEQEANLIASVGRHKIIADEENQEKQIRNFLNAVSLEYNFNSKLLIISQTSAPKKWIAYDGQPTEMDTPYTLRAAHLKDLYETITMKSLAKDERLDALLTLKATVRVSILTSNNFYNQSLLGA